MGNKGKNKNKDNKNKKAQDPVVTGNKKKQKK